MAIKKTDKYADFEYKLSKTELEEAKWLIQEGDFKDLDEFIASSRQAEINIMKREEAAKTRKATIRKNKLAEGGKKKEAA